MTRCWCTRWGTNERLADRDHGPAARRHGPRAGAGGPGRPGGPAGGPGTSVRGRHVDAACGETGGRPGPPPGRAARAGAARVRRHARLRPAAREEAVIVSVLLAAGSLVVVASS